MSDYTDPTLMEAVITRVAATPDPPLRQILDQLVTHLHGSLREVRPTWEELLAGIPFLTAVGQKCDDTRQAFMLLSDTLGVSMLVDLINQGKVGNATEWTVLGPAWVEGAPELPLGSNLAKHSSDGEPCVTTAVSQASTAPRWQAQCWSFGKPAVTGSTIGKDPTVPTCRYGCRRMPQATSRAKPIS
jgi:hydroxyquinol 1,2-dioxygenase